MSLRDVRLNSGQQLKESAFTAPLITNKPDLHLWIFRLNSNVDSLPPQWYLADRQIQNGGEYRQLDSKQQADGSVELPARGPKIRSA